MIAIRVVYRAYGDDDRLLYVGSTSNFRVRRAAHQRRPWFPLVKRWEVDRPQPIFDAELQELLQIRDLAPQFNVRGKRVPKRITRQTA